MTQTPHFHALSLENRGTAGSTVITAIEQTLTYVSKNVSKIAQLAHGSCVQHLFVFIAVGAVNSGKRALGSQRTL